MVASGLVPALTEHAARMACLGAGAKVIRSFSYQLTGEDIDEVDNLLPDIFLLAGGIDGGNEKTITHNAAMLANGRAQFPIILAGNRNAAAECERLLSRREIYRVDNVMPKLDVLNIAPTQKKIRELFLSSIVRAKGLDVVQSRTIAPIMPTPAAVLAAMELLADGTENQRGAGELVALDLGGATTDVYSIAAGNPSGVDTIVKGLPEPYAKRTVEGDIGMRHSICGIIDAVGLAQIAAQCGLAPDEVMSRVAYLTRHPESLPETPAAFALDHVLAKFAILVAMTRHAGTLEEVYTPHGPAFVQNGKDLTEVKKLILTGGAIIHNAKAHEIAQSALFNEMERCSLRPKRADVYVDSRYILAAMGLLAQVAPDVALILMKREFRM